VRVLILQAGDPPESVSSRRGPFARWIERCFDPGHSFAVHDVRGDAPLPSPSDADLFVMTGSSHSVTERAPWMLRAEAFLRALVAADRPFFGICFGHQMFAQALGGHVDKNPYGREIGTIAVRPLATAAEDPLFAGLGHTGIFNATHVDAVVRLPEGAVVLADTPKDPVSAFAFGDNVRCVQFHPEFDGDVMRGYLDARAHLLRPEGLDPEALKAETADTPHGPQIVQNFSRHIAALKRR